LAKRPTPLPLVLPPFDPAGTEPLHRQLYHHLRAAILDKRLTQGSRLPSSRTLAAQLGLSRNTVIAAMGQLQDEGHVESRHGSGTRIAAPASSLAVHGHHPPPAGTSRVISRLARQLEGLERPALRGSLLPLSVGMPALDAFPVRDWSRLLARRWRRPDTSLMGKLSAAGYPPLRQAIADHLGAARGVRCTAEQIIIVAGSQQGLDLAARTLLDPGDQAMVEDPCYSGLLGVLRGCDAIPAPVPVDGQGFNPALAEQLWPMARLACITPSHQFPSGATMPADRRIALIEWAARTGSWIIEDDYDSDFRYGSRPLAALQGLDRHQRTIYCGSFSKSMFPTLRLGWLVLPPDLVDPFLAVRRQADMAPSLLPQAAMADFMIEGHFTAHLRRMRQLYGERRAALMDAAERYLPGLARVTAGEAGTHAIAWLTEDKNDLEVSQAAVAHGIAPAALSQNRCSSGPPGLILGYGNTPAEKMDAAIRALARVLSGH